MSIFALTLGMTLIVGLSGALAAVIAGVPLRWPARRSQSMLLARESEIAASMGLRLRTWYTARAVAFAVCAAAGASTGIPVLVVVGILAGASGLPWLLAGVAARRRVRQARALVATLREVAHRLESSGQPLDTILREIARRPRPEVAGLLAPLATAESVDAAFAASAVASRSALIQRAYLMVASCRARSGRTLVDLLTNLEIPQLEEEIDAFEQARAAQSAQRTTVCVIGGALFVVLWFLNQPPPLHAFYASFTGQFALCIAALVFAGSMLLMAALSRQSAPVRWDVLAARTALEQLRRG